MRKANGKIIATDTRMPVYKNYEDVLKVELVSYTQPPSDRPPQSIPHRNNNGFENSSVIPLIAWCARVSNPANQNNDATADKLINYLIDHKHWSPFESCHVTVDITSTRDIIRQLLRHRSFTFQEFSQRYAYVASDQFVIRECRMQDAFNRQGSISTLDKGLQGWWSTQQDDIIRAAVRVYNAAIGNGIAKEQARVVLPEGNTVSRVIVTGSIRSFIHYLEVRDAEGVQKEHRLMAQEIAKVINTVFNVKMDNGQ